MKRRRRRMRRNAIAVQKSQTAMPRFYWVYTSLKELCQQHEARPRIRQKSPTSV
jgi:hypothetical protein